MPTSCQRYQFTFTTPIGDMIAVSDESSLLSLRFTDQKDPAEKCSDILTNRLSAPIESLISEMGAYFKGELTTFKTPIKFSGTTFQQQCWNELQRIPYGTTISYTEQAKNVQKPQAIRAVANANRLNKLALIVPCHRVIGRNGQLTGYAGGLHRKQYLIGHEKQAGFSI